MTIHSTKQKKSGFTLIEMIGVLAIIAILTALLLPKIFQVLKDSDMTSTLTAINTAKSATIANYGKWGKFANADGTDLGIPDHGDIAPNWDEELLKEGYLEQRFRVRIGNRQVGDDGGSHIRVMNISDNTRGAEVGLANGRYAIGGASGAVDEDNVPVLDEDDNQVYESINDVVGNFLIEAIIGGVSLDDALALDQRIDTGISSIDRGLTGRVKYDEGSDSTTTVYIYIAHR